MSLTIQARNEQIKEYNVQKKNHLSNAGYYFLFGIIMCLTFLHLLKLNLERNSFANLEYDLFFGSLTLAFTVGMGHQLLRAWQIKKATAQLLRTTCEPEPQLV